jgi:DNA-binding NtrC family response regulator
MRVLVCDDDEFLRKAVSVHLGAQGHVVDEVADGQRALERVRRESHDAMILDLQMPGMDGLETLRRLRDFPNPPPVLVMTAYGDIDTAIEATRLGAFAYLTKPLDFREMFVQLDRAVADHQGRTESDTRARGAGRYAKLVGRSPAMTQVFEQLERLEEVSAPTVLIRGESGTGKDLVAQAIHTQGPRASHPFMEIDCASLPEHLIEAELFGYEKGAFTDARQTKPGLFEVAGHGTLFLDEIGEMPIGTQAKLLRALENRSFKRVGGVVQHPLQAAVIAATNRDLSAEVKRGRFREDLWFRLNVIPIEVPPLRARAGDVKILVEHFLQRFNAELGKEVPGFTDEALDVLARYPWPGNVRELRNLIERIVILEGDGGVLEASHLPPEVRFARPPEKSAEEATGDALVEESRPTQRAPGPERFILPREGIRLEEVERDFIRQALDQSAGSRAGAARLLGISRHVLRYRMEKYGLK